MINWSQKFWVVYVQYRFIYEQCALHHLVGNTQSHKLCMYLLDLKARNCSNVMQRGYVNFLKFFGN